MAKKVYIGVNGVARNNKQLCVGVNGISREITNGYIGINGVARQIADDLEQLVNYTMLYDEGDECKSVTGGIVTSKWDGSAIYGVKQANHLEIVVPKLDGWCYFNAVNQVNVSGYTMVFARYSRRQTSYQVVIIGIDTPKTVVTKAIFNQSISLTTLYQNTLFSGDNAADLFNLAVVKADDWTTLCSKAGITAPSSLAALIANTTSINTILNNSGAVNYMVKRCTGDFMTSFVASSSCLTALDSSPYKGKIYANEHWAKFLAMTT